MLFDFKNIGNTYLLHESVDFRKGVVGLSYTLYENNYRDYACGDIFIFFSKNRKSLKVLYYSASGFELWQKKLSFLNRYKIPLNLAENHILSKLEFEKLLGGYSILERGFIKNKVSRIV